MSVVEELTVTDTLDVTNNWYGKTGGEEDEGVGKLITQAFQAGTVFLTVRFFVGIVTVEPYRHFDLT